MVRSYYLKDLLLIYSVSFFTTCTSSSNKSTENAFSLETPTPYDPACRCTPKDSCWPDTNAWAGLGSSVTGRFYQPESPLDSCRLSATSTTCTTALQKSQNPFYLQEDATGTQFTGWLDAWTAQKSEYVVEAENDNDIIAAVNFAKENKLRLVIKGTGHSFVGRSNAPNSLLVWTHRMRDVRLVEGFRPQGCSADDVTAHAVSIEAGARWAEVYESVTVKGGRFVLGGGCTTVGAAGGFLQGGGFGSWSKKFGTSASNLLQAEVITADGQKLVANRCQNDDLFWALTGGGGGTFGVVTKVVLQTHSLPNYFGSVNGTIQATNQTAFRQLVVRFLEFFHQTLNNEHWGEQFTIRPDLALRVDLVSQGLSAAQAETIWKPLKDFVDASNQLSWNLVFNETPGDKNWDVDFFDTHYPAAIRRVKFEGRADDLFYWVGDEHLTSAYWYALKSRWLEQSMFENPSQLGNVLVNAAMTWPISLQVNKAQAGASPEALRRGRQTSIHPIVFDSSALIIFGARAIKTYPQIPGMQPNKTEANQQKNLVNTAARAIASITPNVGSYLNEADYFEENWQEAFWGSNYARLLEIKRKYDPDGLFICHHCVGSEDWSYRGMCKTSELRE